MLSSPLAAFTGLSLLAAFGLVAERTRLGQQLTGAVVTIVASMIAANCGVIPHTSEAYDFVFAYIMPLLVPLFLFGANLRRLIAEATRSTFAFVLASVGTVAGAWVGLRVVDLSALAPQATGLVAGRRPAAIAGLFVATYTGGSSNFAALGDVTGLIGDRSFYAAATAVDNLLGVLFLALIAAMPGWRWLARRFFSLDHSTKTPTERKPIASSLSLIGGLATSLVIIVLGDLIVNWFSIPDWRYVVITLISLVLATAIPDLNDRLAGSFDLGIGLSFVFFAALAAGASFVSMLSGGGVLVVYAATLLAVHAAITFGGGLLLRFSLPELVTASNAAILGATTAPALAAAKGWNNLVTPGILTGVFGYAFGTLLGTVVFKVF